MPIEVNMKLGELEAGTEISIEVKAGKKSRTFHNVVEQVIKGVILINPLVYENKILDLSGEGISITVFANDEEEIPLQFRGCTAKLIRGKEKRYCAIACNNVGKRVNRRGTFRIYIGEKGIVEIPGRSERMEVTVRDLSLMGFAFVTDKSHWEEGVSSLCLEFAGRYGDRIRIQGSLIHATEVENNLLIIGCQIIRCANDLSDYITQKQRENLKKISGK